MMKLQSRISKIDSDLSILDKAMDGLALLKQAYVSNPQQGDADDVYDGIMSSKHERLVLQLQKAFFKSQIDNIDKVVNGG